MKLSRKQRLELFAELRLRRLFTDPMICRRYGISRRSLVRLKVEEVEERRLARIAPDPGAICANALQRTRDTVDSEQPEPTTAGEV